MSLKKFEVIIHYYKGKKKYYGDDVLKETRYYVKEHNAIRYGNLYFALNEVRTVSVYNRMGKGAKLLLHLK